ncbi:MAG: neutral/alkaline non-lysosomal ceramidase N-terminal domain-containing protein, partial [Sedimentisphaerales bacterium]|nr:neutral/alkaline non-lysosomal ceramidase N-terminal domain-containing protein [Sedimentisphaerales bacterium]
MRRACIFSGRAVSSKVIVILICLLVTTSGVLSGEVAGSLQAGVAKVDITPQKPVKMSGYSGRKGLSQGVHDPLSARVVAFSSDGKRLVLVSTDLIGFYSGTAKYLREILLKEFDLDPSELFLSAIHTHAGPTPTIDEEKGHPNNVEYTKNLGERLVEAVGQALGKMEPVCIDTAAGQSSIGSNRRKLVFDKAGNSSIVLGRNPYGVTDKEVLV